jgi:hypothetical protein
MKTTFLLFTSLLTITLVGQDWAPIGAEWYYDVTYAFSGDINFHRIYCDSTFNINGKDCNRINLDYCACNNHFCDKLYTYEVNDTVFFYNPDIDTFDILYDFNAMPGGSWKIRSKYYNEEIDTILVYVDSVGSMEINDKSLKKLFVTYVYPDKQGIGSDKNHENSIIVESLGDLNYIININNSWLGACDINFIHSLRCYEDPELGFYTSGLRESCNYVYYWTSLESMNSFDYINIYPNPVINYLGIENHSGKKLSYEIFDIKGSKLLTGSDTKINLSDLQSGIYFLRLTLNNESIKTIKIMKCLP